MTGATSWSSDGVPHYAGFPPNERHMSVSEFGRVGKAAWNVAEVTEVAGVFGEPPCRTHPHPERGPSGLARDGVGAVGAVRGGSPFGSARLEDEGDGRRKSPKPSITD